MNQTIKKDWALYPREIGLFNCVAIALATVSVFNLPSLPISR